MYKKLVAEAVGTFALCFIGILAIGGAQLGGAPAGIANLASIGLAVGCVSCSTVRLTPSAAKFLKAGDGSVQAENDLESGRVGCIAQIDESETLPDGRSNIIVHGVRRFALQRFVATAAPYYVGEVTDYDDLAELGASLEKVGGSSGREGSSERRTGVGHGRSDSRIAAVSAIESLLSTDTQEILHEQAAQALAEESPAVLQSLDTALAASPALIPAAAPVAEMDEIVAKVLARMNPEILHAVTREILKPLVEAMIKNEMHKK